MSISESTSSSKICIFLAYPELFVSIPRCIQFCIYLDRILGEGHVNLKIESTQHRDCPDSLETLTENPGGTDASFPVLFKRVDSGTMRSDALAGGCLSDDA